jgi:hypothetical protein
MAKKKRSSGRAESDEPVAAEGKKMAGQDSAAPRDVETVSGYFKRIFRERPELLKKRSNDEVFRQWLKDHPGENEVPLKVKQGLSNVKSQLRKKPGRGRAKKVVAEAPAGNGVRTVRTAPRGALEKLEEQIDECLSLAKGLDRDEFASIITHLRRARNEVVWKIGQ